MRTTFRLCLVAAVVAAVGLAAVPTAEAKSAVFGHVSITGFEKKQNRKIRRAKREAQRAHERIESLKDWNIGQDAWNRDQQTSIDGHESKINGLQGLVDTIVAGAGDIVDGLLALQSALENDVGPALTAIDDALNDPVTGLVGLNLARPQFAALAQDATFLGGTGAAGGMGPVDDTDTFVGSSGGGPLPDIDGLYVVDFNNDVSERMYTVNVFPLGPVGAGQPGAVQTASAVNCAATAGAATLCGLTESPGGAADSDPNKVLIQYGNGSSGGPANGFSVTAISG